MCSCEGCGHGLDDQFTTGATHTLAIEFGKLETDRTSISISCVTVVSDDDLQSLLL